MYLPRHQSRPSTIRKLLSKVNLRLTLLGERFTRSAETRFKDLDNGKSSRPSSLEGAAETSNSSLAKILANKGVLRTLAAEARGRPTGDTGRQLTPKARQHAQGTLDPKADFQERLTAALASVNAVERTKSLPRVLDQTPLARQAPEHRIHRGH